MIGSALNDMKFKNKQKRDVVAEAKLQEDLQYLVAFGN